MIKYLNSILWVLALFVTSAVLTMDAMADDVQWSKGFTINCTNATEREDGTALPAAEIGSIKYYAYRDGETTNPEHIYQVMGACKASVIDTKQLTTGIKDFYATTVDIDGRESTTVSTTFVTHNIVKSRPKPPSGLR